MATKNRRERPDGAVVLTEVLERAAPRPLRQDAAAEKTKYAVRFADCMAQAMARDLQGFFPSIEASTKRAARSASGKTQLDINFSTLDMGLALGVSLKSVHVRDVGRTSRYTKNPKRNLEELRTEASGYHRRQPFAVMVAVLFLPFDSCSDGKTNPSSFGAWVQKLRPYAGRKAPEDDIDTFEKIYIALYEPDGSELRFFDVECRPHRNQRPPNAPEPVDYDQPCGGLLSYADFLGALYHVFLDRNPVEFEWADAEPELLELTVDDDEADDPS